MLIIILHSILCHKSHHVLVCIRCIDLFCLIHLLILVVFFNSLVIVFENTHHLFLNQATQFCAFLLSSKLRHPGFVPGVSVIIPYCSRALYYIIVMQFIMLVPAAVFHLMPAFIHVIILNTIISMPTYTSFSEQNKFLLSIFISFFSVFDQNYKWTCVEKCFIFLALE